MAQENTTPLSKLFNNWNNLVAPVRNDLVFENKNKQYGAYFLRANHNKTLAIALLITGIAFSLGIGFPKILEYFKDDTSDIEIPLDITYVDLTPPPLDKKDPTPPPPPQPPPPEMATIKFTTPVVTDEEVNETPPIQNDDITQISTETHEGDDDAIQILDGDVGTGVVESGPEEIFMNVQKRASFPGGEEALAAYVQKTLKPPYQEIDEGVSGTCFVQFVVEKDGSISNVEIIRPVANGPLCNKEALRVIKAMPKWLPGENSGHAVRSYFTVPIVFN